MLLIACAPAARQAAPTPAQPQRMPVPAQETTETVPAVASSNTSVNTERTRDDKSAFNVIAHLLAGPPEQGWEPRYLRMRSWSQADGIVRADVELREQELGVALLQRLAASTMFRDLRVERLDRVDGARPLFVLRFSAKTTDSERLEVHDEQVARAQVDPGTRNPFEDVSARVPRRIAWWADTTPIDKLVLLAIINSGSGDGAIALVADAQQQMGWHIQRGEAVGALQPERDACQWRVTRIETKSLDLVRADASTCGSTTKTWRLRLAPRR